MNNVVSFKKTKSGQRAKAPQQIVDNVISIAEWCRNPRLHRTPNGVYFISHAFGKPTLAT